MGIFGYIVSLSIRACVLVPIAVAARTLLTRYPKRYSYMLWLIVFASLIVKISIPVAVTTPAVQLHQTIQQQYDNVMESYTGEVVIYQHDTEQYTQAVEQGIQPIISEKAQYVITDAESIAPPKTVKNSVMPKVQLVWLAGILAILIVYIRNVLNLLSTVRFAVHYRYDIYYSENITSPFVFGIVKPKIYLPYSITSQQAECVVIHERVHIKRLDYLVKPFCLFITILHWFNPLVWIAFWLMCKDMEFSCDEAAVKLMDGENKKDYCTALLQFALKDESYKMSTVMFGESDCSRRIKNVLGSKRPYKLIAELLVLVVLTMAIGCTVAEKTTQENRFIGMSIEELEQIAPQSDEERLMIWQAMDTLPDSEIEAYLAEKIEKYCAADSLAVFRDISVHQDHLTLVYEDNRKPLQNATAHITLQLLPYDTVDIKTEAEKYMSDMFSWLGEESEFFSFKVEAAGYTVESESGGKIANRNADITDRFENPSIWLNWRTQGPKVWYAEQNETELAAQKIAFNAVKNNKNFMLKKFGIADDGTLRIEYHIEDDYFLKDEGEAAEKLAKQTADINNIYANIGEKVLLHKDVRRYIEAHGIQNAVIAFSNRFLENGVAEFPLILTETEFVPDYDVTVEDSLPEYTEDGIPIDEIKQYPGHIAVVPEENTDEFIWPIAAELRTINVHYGARNIEGYQDFHYGIDIGHEFGTEIYAVADGTVKTSLESAVGDGNRIVIDHGNGVHTFYNHCDKLLVKEGDKVVKGESIATMGSSGNSTGPHLHFAVMKDYEYISPLEFIKNYNEICNHCGGVTDVNLTEFGNVVRTGQEKCSHSFMWGMDIIGEKACTKTSVCRECTLGNAEIFTYDIIECEGYNKAD